jgi:hypothetical protein
MAEKNRRFAALVTLALFAALACAAPAQADGTMKGELKLLAQDIKKLLDERGETIIAVMAFVGSPELPTSSGPGLGKILADELTAAKLTVKTRAKLGVTGNIIPADDSRTKLKVAKLIAKIVDTAGKVIKEFEKEFSAEADVAIALGISVEPTRGADKETRNAEIKAKIEKPTTSLSGTRINAGSSGKFAIELLTKGPDGNYVAREPKDDDGLAFIPLARDDVYGVRLINDSENKVAVSLSIDGLSMFAYSDRKDYTHVILDKGQSALIKGWHHSNEQSREFLVASLPAGDKPIANSAETIGTVTACFHAKKSASVVKTLQTIEGKPVSAKFVEEEFPIGVLLASVTVRYSK